MGREARVNQDLKVINQRLADYFGKDVVTGQPLHRIIDATGVTESRKGNYAVQTEGGLFLRDEIGLVKENLKYPYFQDCHVFEMFVALDKLDEDQRLEIGVTDTRWTYECFYCFKGEDGKPLPVVWRAVEMIMRFKLYGERTKLTEKGEDEVIKQEDAKYIKYTREQLKDEQETVVDPVFGVKGIFVPSNYGTRVFGSGMTHDLKTIDTTRVVKDTIPLKDMQGV